MSVLMSSQLQPPLPASASCLLAKELMSRHPKVGALSSLLDGCEL